MDGPRGQGKDRRRKDKGRGEGETKGRRRRKEGEERVRRDEGGKERCGGRGRRLVVKIRCGM